VFFDFFAKKKAKTHLLLKNIACSLKVGHVFCLFFKSRAKFFACSLKERQVFGSKSCRRQLFQLIYA
jgi:hypothetical protein